MEVERKYPMARARYLEVGLLRIEPGSLKKNLVRKHEVWRRTFRVIRFAGQMALLPVFEEGSLQARMLGEGARTDW